MWELPTSKCELVPRGYGLTIDGSYDFYRKKEDVPTIEWDNHTSLAVPSDIYEWYSVDKKDIDEVKAICGPDQRCSGFFMCSPKGAKVDNCKHLFSPATAVLLSGVPPQSLLLPNADSNVIAKKMAATGGGNANGAAGVRAAKLASSPNLRAPTRGLHGSATALRPANARATRERRASDARAARE